MPGTRTELAFVAAYAALVLLVGAGMIAVVRVEHRAQPVASAEAAVSDATAPPRDHVLVAGTGVALPLLEVLAEAQAAASPVPIRVAPSIGSSGALAALRDGAIDCGVVSRELTEEESAGLRVVPFARATVVLAAGAELPARELAGDELLALVRGERRTWDDGGPVTVLLREPGDSAAAALAARLPGFGEAHDRASRDEVWRTVITDLAMERALVDGPRALGLFDRGTIAIRGLPLQELPVTGLDGAGPVTRTLALVVSGDPPPEVDAFVQHVVGPVGQAVVARWAYEPARPVAPPGGVGG